MDDSKQVAAQDAKTDQNPSEISESQAQPKQELKAEDQQASALSAESKEKPPTKKRLIETGTELRKALDAWNELAKQPRGPSPNEQMLNDVKDLLKQLKDKIEEFK